MDAPINPKLLKVLCEMSDEDLEKRIEFHRYYLNKFYIQKKVRREEKE